MWWQEQWNQGSKEQSAVYMFREQEMKLKKPKCF